MAGYCRVCGEPMDFNFQTGQYRCVHGHVQPDAKVCPDCGMKDHDRCVVKTIRGFAMMRKGNTWKTWLCLFACAGHDYDILETEPTYALVRCRRCGYWKFM